MSSITEDNVYGGDNGKVIASVYPAYLMTIEQGRTAATFRPNL